MEASQTKCQFQNFNVLSELGKGSFGTVYKAQYQKDLQNSNKLFAIKLQNISAIKPMLYLEYEILTKLKKNEKQFLSTKKGFSFPEVLLYKQEEYFSYMAMELLDITLEVIFVEKKDFVNKEMKNIFSKDCLIRIFYNFLKIIESIHKLGYVHRDIKPANFMLKFNLLAREQSPIHQKCTFFVKIDLSYIYPIDLGLCKEFINPLTKQHIKCKQNKKMVGTAIFCSLNTHKGIEQSRRDDIEAIVYMVTYFVKKLPWEIVQTKNNIQKEPQSPKKKPQQKQKLDKYQEIYQIKQETNFHEFLNDPHFLPKSFLEIYKIARKMQFEEEPKYAQIYTILEKEHNQLTNQKISLDQFLCKWENLSTNKKEQIVEPQQKKKIKINFKIPPNKLKKSNPENQIESKQ